jgi:hypothetical protein
MNKRQLPLRDRSPFARRILIYLRAQDPPMSIAELSRNVGVTRQTFYNWIWNVSVPTPDNLALLAQETGLNYGELEQALAASVGWEAPIPFVDFYRMVEHAAQAENWPDKENILPRMQTLLSWQDDEGDHVDLARDVLVQKIPLREKVQKLLFIVRAWEAMR